MGFGEIPPIERPQTYVDKAFRKARRNAREYNLKEYEKSPKEKAKTLALLKLTTINEHINGQLDKIVKNFPSMDNLEEFYLQLVRHSIGEKQLKQALSTIGGLQRQVNTLTRTYRQSIKKGETAEAIDTKLRGYYGRIGSLFERTKETFHTLHSARATIRTFPRLKKNCYTVCIAGFPNVGKSTFLSEITPSTPEIKAYAFTTKSLNVGYRTEQGLTLQLVDTPGTLDRKEKTNIIELQAHLALRYAAESVIYIFDASEESTTWDEQEKLFKRLKRLQIPLITYLSKTDITDSERVATFKNRFTNKQIPLCTMKEEVITKLISFYKESYK